MKMGVGGASAEVDRLLEEIVSDLRQDDVTGRLKRFQYVIDRLSFVLSRDEARLELRMWRTSPLFCKAR
jgi:hypothetical protein